MGYNVVILEDNKIDAKLMKDFLLRSTASFDDFRLVFNKDDYVKTLIEFPVDIVIADFRLKGLNGFDAITLKNEHKPDIPIVIISATIGEEKAVELIKAGASDFLIKNNIETRLEQVCIRAISEKKEILKRQSAENNLRVSLKEKEVLLMEVHHRVKNNLALISAFMHLQAMKVEDPTVQKYLNDNQNRIKSLALLHEQLYQHKNLAVINLKENITDMVERYQSLVSKEQKITFNLSLEEVVVNINQAVPFTLIFNELVTNAIQHAFKEDETGEINILLELVDNSVHLEVTDSGSGLPKNFSLDNCETIGVLMLKTLCQQLTSHLDYSSDNHGSKFSCSFEKAENKAGSSSKYSV